MLFTNSAAMIVDATPAEELGLSLGINQVAFRMGSMAGLTVSGIILSILDWRALFYVNVPIGIFGTAWAHFRLREMGKLERGVPIDWGGFAAFTVFIFSLLLALTVAAYGVSEATTILSLLLLSVAGLVVFVILERRHPHPLLALKLLPIREFTAGAAAAYLLLVVYMMLVGTGLGLFASPNISSIMGSVPPERRGIASGFRATFFNVGYTISLNLAILITTFTVPYALVTRIISSGGTGISEAERILFAQGLKTTYLWLAGPNTLAILPSMLPGRRAHAEEPPLPVAADP